MKPQKPVPRGWPRISVGVFYNDPRAAIDWLCKAFGFDVRLLVEGPDGRVEHSELEYGEGLIMVGAAGANAGKPGQPWRERMASPRATGGRSTQSLCVHIDDAEAHCAAARAAGAEIFAEPTTSDYGGDYWSDRSYGAFDLEGHMWWFIQRLSTQGKPHA